MKLLLYASDTKAVSGLCNRLLSDLGYSVQPRTAFPDHIRGERRIHPGGNIDMMDLLIREENEALTVSIHSGAFAAASGCIVYNPADEELFVESLFDSLRSSPAIAGGFQPAPTGAV
jgi:hypothetical protein